MTWLGSSKSVTISVCLLMSKAPLHKDSTDAEWEERAKELGVPSGAELKAQTLCADQFLEELFRDEASEKARTAEQEQVLKALTELRCVHQAIGSVAARWNRCRSRTGETAKTYERSYDRLMAQSYALTEIIESYIRKHR